MFVTLLFKAKIPLPPKAITGPYYIWELENAIKYGDSPPAIQLKSTVSLPTSEAITGGSLNRLTIDGITSFESQGS
jgi:hypothetical protein